MQWQLHLVCQKKIYHKITTVAKDLVSTGAQIAHEYGIPIVNKRISVTPIALVAAACREDYYLRMMTAWYFATALAKQWDAVIPWLTEHRLDRWTHNKTIQKAIESYRITPEQKAYLRTLH